MASMSLFNCLLMKANCFSISLQPHPDFLLGTSHSTLFFFFFHQIPVFANIFRQLSLLPAPANSWAVFRVSIFAFFAFALACRSFCMFTVASRCGYSGTLFLFTCFCCCSRFGFRAFCSVLSAGTMPFFCFSSSQFQKAWRPNHFRSSAVLRLLMEATPPAFFQSCQCLLEEFSLISLNLFHHKGLISTMLA